MPTSYSHLFSVCCQPVCHSQSHIGENIYQKLSEYIYAWVYVCICTFSWKTLAAEDLCFQCFCFPLLVIFFSPWGIYFTALNLAFSLALPHICSCVAHLIRNPHSSHHSHRFIHLFLWSFTLRKFSSCVTLSEFITYTMKF